MPFLPPALELVEAVLFKSWLRRFTQADGYDILHLQKLSFTANWLEKIKKMLSFRIFALLLDEVEVGGDLKQFVAKLNSQTWVSLILILFENAGKN